MDNIQPFVLGEFTDYVPPSWDELFMRHVYLIASKSKDKFTKIGSILIKNNRIISEGYNGICSMVNDNVVERNERPEKYFWYEHSERNCIYSAARFGISTLDSVLYTNSTPCADCSRAIIQSGITEIVIHKQWKDSELQLNRDKWSESANRSVVMLQEAKVKLRIFDKFLNILVFLDGKVIYV